MSNVIRLKSAREPRLVEIVTALGEINPALGEFVLAAVELEDSLAFFEDIPEIRAGETRAALTKLRAKGIALGLWPDAWIKR